MKGTAVTMTLPGSASGAQNTVVSVALRVGRTGKSQPPSQAHSLGHDLQAGGGPLGVSVIALIIAIAAQTFPGEVRGNEFVEEIVTG
ncbi:MAG: hypothetical protein ACJAVZ_000701 [Afipia broomeae]|jgi:hypothetical protein